MNNFRVSQDIFRVSSYEESSPTLLAILILTEVVSSVTTLFLQLKIVIHYADNAVIQYDFICQRLGLSKDQTGMFKNFVTKTLIYRKNVLKDVFLASGKWHFNKFWYHFSAKRRILSLKFIIKMWRMNN